MARVEINEAVLNTAGAALSGASVQVNVRGGSAATLYSAETGATTVGNPRTTDTAGRIEAWVDEGSYNLVVSKSGYTSYTQPFEAAAGIGHRAIISGTGIDPTGVADSTTAMATAISDATAAGYEAYIPPGTYKITSVIDLPSGTVVTGAGYRTLLKSTAAADASFTFFRNTGWATNTAASDITIRGIRFRRETALSGNEASYSNHINLRLVTNAVVENCIGEGNEGFVHMEACQRWKVRDCYGYRQSDVSYRISVSGLAHTSAHLGLVEGCWAAENGYQLTGGAAISGALPIGSAFVVVQNDVTLRNCGAIDTKENSLELGGEVTGIDVDGWTAAVYTASRKANLLLASCSNVSIRNVRQIVRATGGTVHIFVVGDTGQFQTDINISDCSGYSTVSELIAAITISTRSSRVTVRGCDYEGMFIEAGGTSVTDIDISDCSVHSAREYGFYFAAGTRMYGRRLRAWDNGQNTALADPKWRAGFAFEVGADCAFDDLDSYDTRSGASRTQAYGYYHAHNSTVDWNRNRARNNLTAAKVTDFTPVLAASTYVT